MIPSRLIFAQAILSVAIVFHSIPVSAADVFKPTPDHEVQPGVPQGTVTKMPTLEAKAFPKTTRDWWIYVPAQYKPDGSAALMVFQDGQNYINLKGNWRVPTLFDNLIARGEMPVTIAVFINPGHDPSRGTPKSPTSGSNRSLEYNSLGDRYVQFLLDEILPVVAKQYPFSSDPELRALCGSSSGGIAAFTAAWERPDQFRKVLSTVGSFVNLAGGDAYPALIRKTERKPLRVFLQDTSGDLDNPFGNWPLANRQMDAALRYMGYDVKLEYAEGFGHNSIHGGMVLPAALRWLWRKDKPTPAVVTKGDLAVDMTLHRLLIEGEGWKPVAEGLAFADGPCTDEAGNFYFSDMRPPAAGVYKIAVNGTKTKLSDEGVSGLKFGPDGRLYACQGAKKRLIAITPATGAIEVIAEDIQPNDLAVTHRGHIFITETAKKQITFIDPKTKAKRAVDTGLANPNGITLSPDQGTLAVSESAGEHVWTFRIAPDGTLDARGPYMTMRRPIDPKGEFKFNEPPPYKKASSGDGMTSDSIGRYYVTSAVGVQVFDPTGRLCGVLTKPQPDKPLTSCVLSGPNREYLYVTNGDKIFRRKVQAVGNTNARVAATP
ncbi:SMP-30/gluconolactonase/LRE family protein [Horticoccus sp. 23ND18S-11]|uniref:SMP-30/gluconolactonase/LRE family protein n=1 Tax=Horticoccus sp. 23ND18S-11 TaxID=3391832 RepID=UPI0039C9E5B3